MRKFLLALLLGSAITVHAQKENYNWVFGVRAGLTWNSTQNFEGQDVFGLSGGNLNFNDIPQSYVTSINTAEGCFNVSDGAGKLLFYSDGITVWGRSTPTTNTTSSTDTPITNGNNLTGNNTSAQSGIILPYPGTSGNYIAVTLNTKDGAGSTITENEVRQYLSWSAIVYNTETEEYEIPANKKNIVLTPPNGQFYKELVNAVRHANKRDYWIVAPSRLIDNTTLRNYYKLSVYKVDQNGVDTTPIPQANNLNYVETTTVTHFTSYGQLKFNNAGDRLALITHNRNSSTNTYNNLLIADFNRETGQITILEERMIGIANEQTYSIEFDPTDQYVYITSLTNTPIELNARKYSLYIFNVNDLVNPSIPDHQLRDYGFQKVITGENTSATTHFGSIAKGIDGRLYITENGTRNMFIIPNPGDPSNLKIYRLNEILKSGTSGRLGLPNYAPFYVNTTSEMIPTTACKEVPIELQVNIAPGEGFATYDKIRIDFGDGKIIPITDIRPNNGIPFDPDLLDVLQITQDASTNEIKIRVKHTYLNGGDYVVKASIYDENEQEILEASTAKVAQINTCHLKVNPHIRIQL